MFYARLPCFGGYRLLRISPFITIFPYRPFYWGPVWHPWGFFVTTLGQLPQLSKASKTPNIITPRELVCSKQWWLSSCFGSSWGGTVNNIPSGAQTVNTGTVIIIITEELSTKKTEAITK
ncbi:DUF6515 family protein [Flavobacterium procerum]|uniref:DUF6515 family protein n=1 Tax=Flavobacterium procerum TaxID=1455569 RepID=UPI0035EE0E77